MATRTHTPGFTGSMFLFLSSIGLVSAAITIIFSIASISSLDLGKGMAPVSGGGDRVEAKSAPSETFPIDVGAARAPAEAKPDSDADLLAPPAISSDPALAPQPAPKIGSLPQSVEHPLSGDKELQAEPAVPPMQASATPALSDEDQSRFGSPASPEKPSSPNAQDTPTGGRSPGANISARELRLRRECGPIKDRALRRSCIASFNIDYPAR